MMLSPPYVISSSVNFFVRKWGGLPFYSLRINSSAVEIGIIRIIISLNYFEIWGF